jgi:hypothetical protein
VAGSIKPGAGRDFITVNAFRLATHFATFPCSLLVTGFASYRLGRPLVQPQFAQDSPWLTVPTRIARLSEGTR